MNMVVVQEPVWRVLIMKLVFLGVSKKETSLGIKVLKAQRTLFSCWIDVVKYQEEWKGQQPG
jgi:hypothetical protein